MCIYLYVKLRHLCCYKMLCLHIHLNKLSKNESQYHQSVFFFFLVLSAKKINGLVPHMFIWLSSPTDTMFRIENHHQDDLGHSHRSFFLIKILQDYCTKNAYYSATIHDFIRNLIQFKCLQCFGKCSFFQKPGKTSRKPVLMINY